MKSWLTQQHIHCSQNNFLIRIPTNFCATILHSLNFNQSFYLLLENILLFLTLSIVCNTEISGRPPWSFLFSIYSTSLHLYQFISSNVNEGIQMWYCACLQYQWIKVHKRTVTPYVEFSLPEGRFKHIHIDLVGPLSTYHEFLYLTAVDHFTHWTEFILSSDITAETVSRSFYFHWIARFCTPVRVAKGNNLNHHHFKLLLTFWHSESPVFCVESKMQRHLWTFHWNKLLCTYRTLTSSIPFLQSF